MNTSLNIGKIWGIPIGLNYSWFLVFALITWSLSSSYYQVDHPSLSLAANIGLALVTSLLFFGSVLAHELGHALIALRNRVPVKRITLFFFGGLAQIEREPETPGAEFRIAIAGPLTSLGLAVLFGVFFLAAKSVPWLAAPAGYLAPINLMLAVFNLIPGFPLDGGRVLRAILWKLTGSHRKATRIATIGGQVVAFAFFGLGVYALIGGRWADGLWMLFIGWFLQNAAIAAEMQSSVQAALHSSTVSQAMTQECSLVYHLTPVSQLVDERVLGTGQHCFYITDGVHVLGLLDLPEITRLPKNLWRYTTAVEIMTPLQRLAHLTPEMDLAAALKIMDEAQQITAPVMRGDEVVGTLSRERVGRFLKLVRN